MPRALVVACLFALLLTAAPAALAAQTATVPKQAASPASGPEQESSDLLQDYRLGQLERQLERLENRLEALPTTIDQNLTQQASQQEARMAKQVAAMERWARAEMDSLQATQGQMNLFLCGFGLVATLAGAGVWWNWKRKSATMLENTKKEIEEIADSCRAFHGEIKNRYDEINDLVETTKDPKTLTDAAKRKVNQTASDSEAPMRAGLQARGLKAEMAERWEEAMDIWKVLQREEPYNSNAHFHFAYCACKASQKEINKEKAQNLLEQAISLYKLTTDLDPQSAAAFSNWGVALSNLGKMTKDLPKIEAALEKHKRATELDPQNAAAFDNWSVALSRLSHYVDDPEQRRKLLLEARNKAQEAENLKPGTGAYNLACAASLFGESDECRRWLEVCLELGTMVGCEHFRSDTDLDPVRKEAWFQEIEARVCQGVSPS